jgi:hypothetical protein
MGVGTLTIYSASAGSGKTHQLAGILKSYSNHALVTGEFLQ